MGDFLLVPGGSQDGHHEKFRSRDQPGKTDEKKKTYKMLPPSMAAKRIIQGMEKDHSRVLVGSDSKFMDFYCRLAPQKTAGLIAQKLDNT
jgi:short-subunit dehydrogenase